jgi:biotin synthase
MESPKYVRISQAAALTLKLEKGKFYRNAKLFCINILLNYKEGCAAACAYCGLSKSRIGGPKSFIRVNWPIVPLNEVIRRIEKNIAPHVERICVSMITNKRAKKDTLEIVTHLRSTSQKISVLVAPTIVDEEYLKALKSLGVDIVGIAIDACTKQLFKSLRGPVHTWDKYWETLIHGIDIFGKRNVSCHLIVGLGESEEEMVATIQKVTDLGAEAHLFSFFPEPFSKLSSMSQPPIGMYRRIQIARYLIDKGLSRYDKMKFRDGQVVDFGISKDLLVNVINKGIPFMTTGCRGKIRENCCNRPFSNSTPYQAYIGELRNFPFPPLKNDIKIIEKQYLQYGK